MAGGDNSGPVRQRVARLRAEVGPDWVALAVLVAGAYAYLLWEGRDLTFFRDEWLFVLYRDGHNLENFLSSHAGHFYPLLTGYYLFLFKAAGLDSYEVYLATALLVHLLSAVLLFVLIRRRLGAVPALAGAAILLLLGSSWMDILWPFQIAFTGSVACGLIAFLFLDRDDLPGDALACLSLTVGIASSGVGVPFLAAAAAGLLARRRLLRRLWVVAAPALIYGAWTIRYGDQEIDYAANLEAAPEYLARMAGAGVNGILHLPQSLSAVIAVAGLVAVAAWLLWSRRGSPLAWQALAGAAAFWGITALARAQDNDPTASRYVYPSVVFLLLLAAEVAGGARRGWVTAAAVAIAAVSIPFNVRDMNEAGDGLRFNTQVVASELGAVEIAREVVEPDFAPHMREFGLPAAAYLAAVDRYGSSPAYSPEEIRTTTEHAKGRADRTLVRAERIGPRPARSPGPTGRCRRLAARSSLEARLPAGGIRLLPGAGGATLRLRRYAAEPVAEWRIPGRAPHVLVPPADLDPETPWRARVVTLGRPAELCFLKVP